MPNIGQQTLGCWVKRVWFWTGWWLEFLGIERPPWSWRIKCISIDSKSWTYLTRWDIMKCSINNFTYTLKGTHIPAMQTRFPTQKALLLFAFYTCLLFPEQTCQIVCWKLHVALRKRQNWEAFRLGPTLSQYNLTSCKIYCQFHSVLPLHLLLSTDISGNYFVCLGTWMQ